MNQVDISHALVMFLAICTNLRNDCSQTERTTCVRLGRAFGYLFALNQLGIITTEQQGLLSDLAKSADFNKGKPFPSRHNAGPQMTPAVWLARTYPVQLDIEEAPANECSEEVSASAPRRELQLLCVLGRHGSRLPASPLLTLRAMPPRVDKLASWSRWSSSSVPGLYMRETHAIAPAPEVLARLQRHGQARSVCAAESPRRYCATV